MIKVLGIDPGTRKVGYAILECEGSSLHVCGSGTINAKTTLSIAERLQIIHAAVIDTILTHSPAVLAVEKAFYGKNIQSAIRMGEGRGVILLAAAQHNLPIAEYDATQIKKAVVGSGTAHKTQVQFMVQNILGIDKKLGADEADALAIAICHSQRIQFT